MPGNRHDGTGSVAHEYIIRHPYRYLLSVYRIGRSKPLDFNAGLLLCQLRPFKVGLSGGLVPVGDELLIVFDLIPVFLYVRVLRADDHISGPEQGIRPRGIDPELIIRSRKREIDLGSHGLTYPVSLGYLDSFYVIDTVKPLQKLVGIIRDLKHPLALGLSDNGRTAALADTVYDLFVCKPHLTGGTPVDGHGSFVGKPLLKQL